MRSRGEPHSRGVDHLRVRLPGEGHVVRRGLGDRRLHGCGDQGGKGTPPALLLRGVHDPLVFLPDRVPGLPVLHHVVELHGHLRRDHHVLRGPRLDRDVEHGVRPEEVAQPARVGHVDQVRVRQPLVLQHPLHHVHREDVIPPLRHGDGQGGQEQAGRLDVGRVVDDGNDEDGAGVRRAERRVILLRGSGGAAEGEEQESGEWKKEPPADHFASPAGAAPGGIPAGGGSSPPGAGPGRFSFSRRVFRIILSMKTRDSSHSSRSFR